MQVEKMCFRHFQVVLPSTYIIFKIMQVSICKYKDIVYYNSMEDVA